MGYNYIKIEKAQEQDGFGNKMKYFLKNVFYYSCIINQLHMFTSNTKL